MKWHIKSLCLPVALDKDIMDLIPLGRNEGALVGGVFAEFSAKLTKGK